MAIPPITDLLCHKINMKMSVSYAIDYKLDNIVQPLLPNNYLPNDLPILNNYNRNNYRNNIDNLSSYELEKEIKSTQIKLALDPYRNSSPNKKYLKKLEERQFKKIFE
ncbi:hypothetical protein HN415_00230 [Candidatus Woesearchaeota archaeon]|jgi:hypothetical protein|nr:hypothetical protein [Candidatus Woesearchaeota archaeon]